MIISLRFCSRFPTLAAPVRALLMQCFEAVNEADTGADRPFAARELMKLARRVKTQGIMARGDAGTYVTEQVRG